jgi:methylase of polypeptide subunit release factors
MKGYRPVMSFDAAVAAEVRAYRRGDEAAAVAFLAQQAQGGPALELAIGTGRIALPLAAQGIRVDGVDIAPSMVAETPDCTTDWATWPASSRIA